VGTIENSTIFGNIAYETGGGGILTNGGGTAQSTTITGNESGITSDGLTGGGISNKYEEAFVLENSIVTAREIEDLATLPSREELLGKLLGLINSPIQGLVNVLSGPSRGFVQVLSAYAEKQGAAAESAA